MYEYIKKLFSIFPQSTSVFSEQRKVCFNLSENVIVRFSSRWMVAYFPRKIHHHHHHIKVIEICNCVWKIVSTLIRTDIKVLVSNLWWTLENWPKSLCRIEGNHIRRHTKINKSPTLSFFISHFPSRFFSSCSQPSAQFIHRYIYQPYIYFRFGLFCKQLQWK